MKQEAVAANVRVDFTTHRVQTSPLSLGSCISTYADGGSNLIKGPQRDLLRGYLADLGPLVWRIPLYHHDGQVGSSAGGVHGGNEGAQYITAIRGINGTPMIAVGGSTNDNDIRASDAAALVRYFNDGGGKNGGPVDYFIIGNEPDNGFGMSNYIQGGAGNDGFNNIVGAMRSASSRRLYIAGPSLVTWADYKFSSYQEFFSAAAPNVDIIDFHKYGDGERYDNLLRTSQYADAVRWFQGQLPTYFGSRSGSIAIQAGEFNYHPYYNGWNDVFYTSRNLVHTASVIGQLLREGARAYQYADNNGPLGLITDGTGNNGQPSGQFVRLPTYWGLAAWTGGTWFRRYGQWMVEGTTTLPEFEVFATDESKKVLLLNKSATANRVAELELVGAASGVYSVWNFPSGMDPADFTNGPQFKPPVPGAQSQPFSGGRVQVDVPAMSVVVLFID
ncbi:hypothetical protein [Cystobacter ferrugineus]|uniref:Alpha-L-arabinofuranosidase C-terminal domain-containing protein n=1 Tax=Cystobacter ferrugineus TaxID=83449 RepID=A0A1L9BJV8_9BACT|nr:hypothetical protein [Cystobacter ferrugineus]OJH42604.1 hypothetical protein BON30_05305 [Cystobacter ferrugineus]